MLAESHILSHMLRCWFCCRLQAEIVPIKSCTLEGAFQLQLYCET